MLLKIEESWPQLNCLVPVYGQGDDAGNYTEIWLDDGRRELIRNKLKTVLRRLATSFGVTLDQGQAYWRQMRHRRHETSLVLAPDLVLIPLRLRRPRLRDEGGSGYAVLAKVKTWEKHLDGEFRSRLIFYNGDILPCLLTPDKIACRLKEGEEARRCWQELVEGFPAARKAREKSNYYLQNPEGKRAPVKLLNREGPLLVIRLEKEGFS